MILTGIKKGSKDLAFHMSIYRRMDLVSRDHRRVYESQTFESELKSSLIMSTILAKLSFEELPLTPNIMILQFLPLNRASKQDEITTRLSARDMTHFF